MSINNSKIEFIHKSEFILLAFNNDLLNYELNTLKNLNRRSDWFSGTSTSIRCSSWQ